MLLSDHRLISAAPCSTNNINSTNTNNIAVNNINNCLNTISTNGNNNNSSKIYFNQINFNTHSNNFHNNNNNSNNVSTTPSVSISTTPSANSVQNYNISSSLQHHPQSASLNYSNSLNNSTNTRKSSNSSSNLKNANQSTKLLINLKNNSLSSSVSSTSNSSSSSSSPSCSNNHSQVGANINNSIQLSNQNGYLSNSAYSIDPKASHFNQVYPNSFNNSYHMTNTSHIKQPTSQNSSLMSSSVLSDRLLVKQAKLKNDSNNFSNGRATNSYIINSTNLNEASEINNNLNKAQQQPSESQQIQSTTSSSYISQTLNPNRLSSYDNYVISFSSIQDANAAISNTGVSENNDFGELVQNEEPNLAEYNSNTLPNHMLTHVKFSGGRKRSTLVSNQNSNNLNNNNNNHHHHHHSTSVPPLKLESQQNTSSNMFVRAFNYAKKATSTNGSSSNNRSGSNTIGKSWKSKLGKYLTSNSSSKINKLNVDQDGCEIIVDEDMFSSYHLSRKNPAQVLKPLEQNLVTNSANNKNNMILLTNQSLVQNTNKNPYVYEEQKLHQFFDEKGAEHNRKDSFQLLASQNGSLKKNLSLSKNKSLKQQPKQNNSHGLSTSNIPLVTNGFNSLRKIFKISSNQKKQNSKGSISAVNNEIENEFIKKVSNDNESISLSATPVPNICAIMNPFSSYNDHTINNTTNLASTTSNSIKKKALNNNNINYASASRIADHDFSSLNSKNKNAIVSPNLTKKTPNNDKSQNPYSGLSTASSRFNDNDNHRNSYSDLTNDHNSCSSSTIIQIPIKNIQNKFNYPQKEEFISSNDSYNTKESKTLDRQQMKKKEKLKKQKSFSSATNNSNNIYSSSILDPFTSNTLNISSGSSLKSSGTTNDSSIKKILMRSSPNRSFHSLSLQERGKNTNKCEKNNTNLKKPLSSLMLNQKTSELESEESCISNKSRFNNASSSSKKSSNQNINGNSRVLSMLKIYKNVLNRIQKPGSSLCSSQQALNKNDDCQAPSNNKASVDKSYQSSSAQKTSLSSSCLNGINTKALLLNSQFNCVKSNDYSNNRNGNHIDSSSSVFSYEFHNEAAIKNNKIDDEEINDNDRILNSSTCSDNDDENIKKNKNRIEDTNITPKNQNLYKKNLLHSDANRFEPINIPSSKTEKSDSNKVRQYDGYKSLFKQIDTHKSSSSNCNDIINNNNNNSNLASKISISASNNKIEAGENEEMEKGEKQSNKKEINSSNNHNNNVNHDEDVLCDLEVASFFNSNKKFKTSIIQLEGNNFCYCYHEESENKLASELQDNQNPIDIINTDINCNQNNQNEIDDDEDTQNLDYLVKQLVAEASLSDLNIVANYNSIPKSLIITENNKNTLAYDKKLDDYIEDLNNNLETASFDLEQSELVDDENNDEIFDDEEVDDLIENNSDEFGTDDLSQQLENSDDEAYEDENDLIHEVSLGNYGTNGFQSLNQAGLNENLLNNRNDKEKYDKFYKNDISDDSLAEIDMSYGNSNSKNSSNYMTDNKRNANDKKILSNIYSNSIDISPFNKISSNKLKPSDNSTNKLISTINSNNSEINNIKIEKKIRLNYRKPQDTNNLLNFGTLC